MTSIFWMKTSVGPSLELIYYYYYKKIWYTCEKGKQTPYTAVQHQIRQRERGESYTNLVPRYIMIAYRLFNLSKL